MGVVKRFGPARMCVVLVLVLGACERPAPTDAPASDDVRASEDAARRTAPAEEGGEVARRLEAATVAARVRLALVEERRLRAFDFEAEVDDGRLVLRGTVRTDAQRLLAGALAREVDGVREVVNEVQVTE